MRCKGYIWCSSGLICLVLLLAPLWACAEAGTQEPVRVSVSIRDTTEVLKLIEKAEQFFKAEKYQSSIEQLHRAEALARPLHVRPMGITISRHMFAAYQQLGKLDSAHMYANTLLDEARMLRDPEAEMDAWNYKAILYMTNLEMDAALNAYQNAYALAAILGHKRAMAGYSSNMGIIFGQQQQYEKAYNYFRKAYLIGQEISDTSLIIIGAMNIGRGLTEEAKFDSATYYLDRAQQLADIIQDQIPSRCHEILNFQALLNFRRGNFEQAEIQYKELVNIYSDNQQNAHLAEVYGRLAEINLAREHYREAILYGQTNLELLRGLPAREKREQALLVLTQAYGHLHLYREAFEYGEQYRQLRDSSYGEKMTRRVAEIESKYELEQKKNENSELSREAQRQKKLARKQTTIALIASLSTVTILGILFFFYLKYEHKKHLNQQLEATVKDRTARLEASNQKLKKYVEELRTFGYITSHDLKEPLRNISGFSRLLERKLEGKLDIEGKEFLSYIQQNTHQMNELIQDILLYSTLDDLPSENQPVPLTEAVQKAKADLEPLISKRNGKVDCQELPRVVFNEPEIVMILKNLIENGLTYNKSERPEVHLSYERTNGHHRIHVRDNGIGIPPEYQDQIFQLSKRLHNRSEYSGTGMGLAISRKLVSRLGGELLVKSNGKEGSTFSIILPATA